MSDAHDTLYRVTSIHDDWPHRGHRFDGVELRWLVAKRAVAWTEEDIRRLLDADDPREPWQHLQLDDYLTASQLAGLRAYLAGRADLRVEALELPIRSCIDGVAWYPLSAMPLGGMTGMLGLWLEADYDLADHIGGYYRMDEDTVEHAPRFCSWDPSAGPFITLHRSGLHRRLADHAERRCS